MPLRKITIANKNPLSFQRFLRTHEGTIITFEAPGAQYTTPQSINGAGVITGAYIDANGMSHGFLRTREGAIRMFDPLGSLNTTASAINGRAEQQPDPSRQINLLPLHLGN